MILIAHIDLRLLAKETAQRVAWFSVGSHP